MFGVAAGPVSNGGGGRRSSVQAARAPTTSNAPPTNQDRQLRGAGFVTLMLAMLPRVGAGRNPLRRFQESGEGTGGVGGGRRWSVGDAGLGALAPEGRADLVIEAIAALHRASLVLDVGLALGG